MIRSANTNVVEKSKTPEDIGGKFMDYMVGDDLIEEFRDGIFALRTRRFGTVAEIMVKRLWL